MQSDQTDPTDEWLIQQYRATKEQQYFEMLYQRYAHLVELACFRYLEDASESKDAAMTVFEKTLQRLQVEPIEHVGNWLFIVVRNTCISLLRKRKRRWWIRKNYRTEEKKGDLFMEKEIEWQLVQKAPQPMLDLVPKAMQQLKPIQQECLLLFFQQKMNYKEIAEELQMEVKEIKSHLQNGKRKLKKILLELHSNQ